MAITVCRPRSLAYLKVSSQLASNWATAGVMTGEVEQHCVSLFIHFGAARPDRKVRPQLRARESRTQSASSTASESFLAARPRFIASFDRAGSLPSRITSVMASSTACQSVAVVLDILARCSSSGARVSTTHSMRCHSELTAASPTGLGAFNATCIESMTHRFDPPFDQISKCMT